MKILIAYDGSECADAAIEDLRQSGLPSDLEAVVMNVADVREIPTSPLFLDRVSSRIEKLMGTARDELQSTLSKHLTQAETLALDAVRRIKEIFPGWQVSAETAGGKPADELIKKADAWQPDLLVIGSHGRSAIGRAVLGSVSQKVLHESRCSVRIARKEKDADSTVRILVAVDGSLNSEAAVKAVASRHWMPNTEIRLIAVDDPFTRPEAGYINWDLEKDKPEDNEKAREWISRVIDAPAHILETAGLKVSHNIRWGDAANMILNEAEEWNPDAIFVGARGHGRLKRFLLGSVSSAVAARARCTVEVVRS